VVGMHVEVIEILEDEGTVILRNSGIGLNNSMK
jgi:hypothetical protein